jgi:hypothetical protein
MLALDLADALRRRTMQDETGERGKCPAVRGTLVLRGRILNTKIIARRRK